jgi:hypothetical protein
VQPPSNLDLANFYAVRETISPPEGSVLYKLAIAAGQSADKAANPYFAKAYAAIQVIAQTLKACGETCSTDKFASTLKGMGDIKVPNEALVGPLNFAKGQSGLTLAQVWTWDSAAKKPAARGAAFSITS